jgi:hypothetical protein
VYFVYSKEYSWIYLDLQTYTSNVYEQPYYNVHVYSSNIFNINNLDIMVLLSVSSKSILVINISCIYAIANHFVVVYGTPSCFYQMPWKIVGFIVKNGWFAHMLEMHGFEWTKFFIVLYAHYSVNHFFWKQWVSKIHNLHKLIHYFTFWPNIF